MDNNVNKIEQNLTESAETGAPETGKSVRKTIKMPEFLTVAYDTDKVIQEMKDENLYELAPYWTKVSESLLKGGNISHGHVLFRAMELCEQETGTCNWPEVPEKYWQQACREMLGK